MSENWEWLIGKSLILGKVVDVVDDTATVRHGDDEFRITVSELLCEDYRSRVRQAMRPKAKQPLMVRIRELESINADLHEALGLLLSFHESVGSPSPAAPVEMARAALAKAR